MNNTMKKLLELTIRYPTFKQCVETYMLAVERHYKKVAKQYFITIDNILLLFAYDVQIITPKCMCDIRNHLITYAKTFKMNIP